jgi:drug/metabolite transporter (DMT)-like permease
MSTSQAEPTCAGTPERPRASLAWASVAILLWGTLAASVGDALRGVSPGTLAFLSLTFGAATLSVAERLRGGRVLSPRPSVAVVALGVFGIFGYHICLFVALARAPLVEANLLNYLWPLFMVLLSRPLGGEHPTRGALPGAVIGFGGALLVVSQGKRLEFAPAHAFGYALALAAALTWSSFSVLLRRVPAAQGRMPLYTCASALAAGAYVLISGDFAWPTPRALAAAAWMGIGPMGLAFVCWDRGLALGRAATIGALSYLDPLLSTVTVAIVLHRKLSLASITGMALIIVGAALPTLRKGASRA